MDTNMTDSDIIFNPFIEWKDQIKTYKNDDASLQTCDAFSISDGELESDGWPTNNSKITINFGPMKGYTFTFDKSSLSLQNDQITFSITSFSDKNMNLKPNTELKINTDLFEDLSLTLDKNNNFISKYVSLNDKNALNLNEWLNLKDNTKVKCNNKTIIYKKKAKKGLFEIFTKNIFTKYPVRIKNNRFVKIKKNKSKSTSLPFKTLFGPFKDQKLKLNLRKMGLPKIRNKKFTILGGLNSFNKKNMDLKKGTRITLNTGPLKGFVLISDGKGNFTSDSIQLNGKISNKLSDWLNIKENDNFILKSGQFNGDTLSLKNGNLHNLSKNFTISGSFANFNQNFNLKNSTVLTLNNGPLSGLSLITTDNGKFVSNQIKLNNLESNNLGDWLNIKDGYQITTKNNSLQTQTFYYKNGSFSNSLQKFNIAQNIDNNISTRKQLNKQINKEEYKEVEKLDNSNNTQQNQQDLKSKKQIKKPTIIKNTQTFDINLISGLIALANIQTVSIPTQSTITAINNVNQHNNTKGGNSL